MIVCYKCGGKYEDDMPRCLWCDALNPEHPLNKEPAPSLTEKASAQASPGIAVPPVVKQTVVEQVAPVATETLPDAGASDIKSCETSPELGDTVAVVEPGREQDVAIERQFRQKGILWSVVLAGPFISWLCHYKSLKLVDRFSTKFFLPFCFLNLIYLELAGSVFFCKASLSLWFACSTGSLSESSVLFYLRRPFLTMIRRF